MPAAILHHIHIIQHVINHGLFSDGNVDNITLDALTNVINSTADYCDRHQKPEFAEQLIIFKECILDWARSAIRLHGRWVLTLELGTAASDTNIVCDLIKAWLATADESDTSTPLPAEARRRRRGRPPGSRSAERDRRLYLDWKAANQTTGITKAEFLRERRLPESYLSAIERGRALEKRRRSGRN